MLGIAALGTTALGDVGGQRQSGSGGGGGGGGSGGGGGGGSSGLPAASFVDRRGVLSAMLDSAVAGNPSPRLAIKLPARAATTGAAIALSGLLPVDGVALAEGDRVLVKDQTDPTANGLYAASSGNWARTPDADGNADFAPGFIVEVAQGNLNAGTIYTFTGAATMAVALGATALTFTSLSINPPVAFDPILDSGGTGLVPGLKLQLEVPARIRLKRWTLFADQAGSIVVDIWRAPFASLPLSSANSICGGAPPALNGTQFGRSSNLSAWQIDLAPGDILGFSITNVAQLQRVKVSLYGARPQ